MAARASHAPFGSFLAPSGTTIPIQLRKTHTAVCCEAIGVEVKHMAGVSGIRGGAVPHAHDKLDANSRSAEKTPKQLSGESRVNSEGDNSEVSLLGKGRLGGNRALEPGSKVSATENRVQNTNMALDLARLRSHILEDRELASRAHTSPSPSAVLELFR
jgi:hypothetical protein